MVLKKKRNSLVCHVSLIARVSKYGRPLPLYDWMKQKELAVLMTSLSRPCTEGVQFISITVIPVAVGVSVRPPAFELNILCHVLILPSRAVGYKVK